jgi:hypothetical protein
MKKTEETDKIVRYSISSFDFNAKHQWENLGMIEIDKSSGTYLHKNDTLWEKSRIYPIKLFELKPDEIKVLAYGKYKSYGSGRWAQNVYNFIKTCIESRDYPDENDLIT